MMSFAKHDKIRIIGVIVLYEHSFILKTNDTNPVLVIFLEGGNTQTKSRARSELLARSRRLAPVQALNRP